jgi:Receptor family ligand binding region
MVVFQLNLVTFCFVLTSATLQNVSNNETSLSYISTEITNAFAVDVNDSITIDYMMDDASWKFSNNTTDEDVFYSENYEPVNFLSQIAMSQLAQTNLSDSRRNENMTRHLKTQNHLKVDDIHWPIKKEAVMEGHVILGGLMMVHEREDNMTCGPIMPQGGIQALEAMLFTLDRINNMKLLNNVTIGAHILDDCDKDTYGLEMAVDFIRGEYGEN